MKNRFKTLTLVKLCFVYIFGKQHIGYPLSKKCPNRSYYTFKEFLLEKKKEKIMWDLGLEIYEEMTAKQVLMTKV